jgi:hypothetical protein
MFDSTIGEKYIINYKEYFISNVVILIIYIVLYNYIIR